ncbi:porin [Beggiatoa alba]|nr:porin [Beggiatoa alba]
MNNKIIAIAIATALAAPMAAQAAPKLYGHLQAELTDFDKAGTNTLQIDDNKRGRIGIKGSEDLGGGLKAIYKFEWQVDTTKANPNNGNREAYVGLKGGFGTINMGAVKSPYKYFGGVKYDIFVGTNLEARGNGGMIKNETGLGAKFGSNSFLTDSISYQTKLGSATLWAAYAMSETDPGKDDLVLGVKVKLGSNGEVFVAQSGVDDATTTAKGDNTKIGGSWKFGSSKIMAQLETGDNDGDAAKDNDTMFLAYHFKMGKTTIVAQLGEVDFDASTSSDIDYTALGVVYKMSKKTRVFAGIRSTDVDGGTTGDVDAVSVGMRIDF